MGHTGAEPPQPAPLGIHGSFVRASKFGSGHPASGTHHCTGIASASIPIPSLWERGTCFPQASLLPATAASAGTVPMPGAMSFSQPLEAAGKESLCMHHLRAHSTIGASCQLGKGRLLCSSREFQRFLDLSLIKPSACPRYRAGTQYTGTQPWQNWEDAAMGNIPLSSMLNPPAACGCRHC